MVPSTDLSTTPSVVIGLLGPMVVVVPDGAQAVNGRQQQILLALLAREPGKAVSREMLIEHAWSGSPPPSASAALRVHLARLRKVLASPVTVRDPLPHQGTGYLLDSEHVTTDVVQVEQLAARASALAGRGAHLGAGVALREALATWRGRALAGLDDIEPLAHEANRLEQLRARLEEDLVDARLANGEHEAACEDIAVLVQRAPLRERRTAQHMLALYRTGRQADALAACSALRRALAAELGIDPSDEVQRLEGAILRQEAHLSGPRSAQPVRAVYVSPSGQTVPAAMQALAAQRTAHLSPLCKNLLLFIAILGETSSIAILAEAARTSPTEVVAQLTSAVGSGVLTGPSPGARPAFAHALLGPALLARLTVGEIRQLHASAGRAIDAVHGVSATPHTARHLLAAVPAVSAPTACRVAALAADECLRTRDARSARDLCTTALDAIAGHTESNGIRVDLLIRLSQATALDGALEEAEDLWRKSVDAARDLSDPERFALAVLAHDWGRRTVVSDSGDRGLLTEALARLGDSPNALRVRVASALLAEATVPGRAAELRTLADEIRLTAPAVGDDLALVSALHAEHVLLRPRAEADARQRAGRTLEHAADRLGDPYWSAVARLATLFDAVTATRGNEFPGRFAALGRYVDTSGSPRLSWHRLLTEGTLHQLAGRFGDARRCAERAVVEGAAAGIPDAMAAGVVQRFLVELMTTSVVPLLPLLKHYVDTQPSNVLARAAFALSAAQSGDLAGSTDAVDEVVGAADPRLPDEFFLLSLALVIEAELTKGRMRHLALLTSMLLPYSGQFIVFGQVTGEYGPVDRLLAVMARAMGDVASAQSLLEAAQRSSEQALSPPWVIRCVTDRVALMRVIGQTEQANALAQEHRSVATTLGLAPCAAGLAVRT